MIRIPYKISEHGKQVAAMQQRSSATLIFIVLLWLTGGCSRDSSSAQKKPDPPKLAGLPVEMTVKQRSTTAVQGSDGRLMLTIDDITRNQVIVTLASENEIVLASTSLSPGFSAPFEFGNFTYVLMLKSLNTALVSEDFATFVVSAASDGSLTETEKIERLIESVRDLKDATFIRNDTEHTAAEAADHLQLKWRAKANKIEYAHEFIDTIASKSSVSGKPYQIRMADGTTVEAGDYFKERLREVESGD